MDHLIQESNNFRNVTQTEKKVQQSEEKIDGYAELTEKSREHSQEKENVIKPTDGSKKKPIKSIRPAAGKSSARISGLFELKN